MGILIDHACIIRRDAVSDMALHFLSKLKIMVIKDIERDQIEFVSKTLGCTPAASLDHFKVRKRELHVFKTIYKNNMYMYCTVK